MTTVSKMPYFVSKIVSKAKSILAAMPTILNIYGQ